MKDTFTEFYSTTFSLYNQNSQGMRLGQFFMNRLSTVNLDLYRNVPENLDPFYDDKLFGVFCEWLESQWFPAVYD